MIELGRAETDPRHAVMATVAAGCSLVRVTPSPDGSEVWVTARGDNAVLGFSANRILTDPSRALDARVSVGSEPVGLLPVDGGHRLVIADSDRSSASGIGPRLDVIDAQSALAGRPALPGSVGTGSFPREMAAIPNSKTLLVTNYRSRQVEAVNLADLP